MTSGINEALKAGSNLYTSNDTFDFPEESKDGTSVSPQVMQFDSNHPSRDVIKAADPKQGLPLTERTIEWVKQIVGGVKAIFSSVYEKIFGSRTVSPELNAMNIALQGGVDQKNDDVFYECNPLPDDVFYECSSLPDDYECSPLPKGDPLEELKGEFARYQASHKSGEIDLPDLDSRQTSDVTVEQSEPLASVSHMVLTRVDTAHSYMAFEVSNKKLCNDDALLIYATLQLKMMEQLEGMGRSGLIGSGGVDVQIDLDNNIILANVSGEAAKELGSPVEQGLSAKIEVLENKIVIDILFTRPEGLSILGRGLAATKEKAIGKILNSSTVREQVAPRFEEFINEALTPPKQQERPARMPSAPANINAKAQKLMGIGDNAATNENIALSERDDDWAMVYRAPNPPLGEVY
ncbi:hypothetical protein [Pseudochelatococcus sp. G4_1912]|uniref:hypothetical protein n=1 Tax=Pseudochelatococcus sp. G4_1912 TaxID=3114288 RepID=UPI0039C6E427